MIKFISNQIFKDIYNTLNELITKIENIKTFSSEMEKSKDETTSSILSISALSVIIFLGGEDNTF